MENRSFYNEILTEHNLHPEFKHDLPDADIVLEGVNPSCGDDIFLKLKLDGDVIKHVEFVGGCSGNTQGVAKLVEGMKAEEAISRLEGILCGSRPTSCPDQLAKALKQALAQ